MFGQHWEVGLNQPLQIREVTVQEQHNPCRVLFISDIHLRPRRSQMLCDQVITAACSAQPDLILLGGDLLDQTCEKPHLTQLAVRLRELAPVLAVEGNHDVALGISPIRRALESGGVRWIQDSVLHHTHDQRVISICGPDYRDSDAAPGDTKILCAHNPRIWKSAQNGGFDLVLAGHLHGCQFVAFEFRDRLYPGAWFYPYCYLTHRRRSTTFVVSRGVSDLIPIRWRCPREVVLCLV